MSGWGDWRDTTVESIFFARGSFVNEKFDSFTGPISRGRDFLEDVNECLV
jgi:hypothetical protein